MFQGSWAFHTVTSRHGKPCMCPALGQVLLLCMYIYSSAEEARPKYKKCAVMWVLGRRCVTGNVGWASNLNVQNSEE